MATAAERSRSFGAIAEDYDRLRPGPPDAAVDWLLPAGCQVAVDVGAGTGLLTRALARKVPRVVAVEPDERMRAVLMTRSPAIEALAGRGEAIPLPDASADGVFISSAWHWMDPERAMAEVTRVLRDGGRFGLIWTRRDSDTGWLHEISLREPRARPGGSEGPRRRSVALPADAQLGNIMTRSFSFALRMSADALIDMLGTYSGVITASPANRAAGLARARAALDELFPGASEIDVPMRAGCWRADRIARTR
ncbi:MAG TPA: class I SAM-dependent methyltransferase [Streptosporangiaceae bacterium]